MNHFQLLELHNWLLPRVYRVSPAPSLLWSNNWTVSAHRQWKTNENNWGDVISSLWLECLPGSHWVDCLERHLQLWRQTDTLNLDHVSHETTAEQRRPSKWSSVIWRAAVDFQHGVNQSISFHTIGKIVWLLISLTNVRETRDKLSGCPMNYLFQQLSLRHFQSKSNAICGMMSLSLEGPSNQYAAATLEVKTLRPLVISVVIFSL